MAAKLFEELIRAEQLACEVQSAGIATVAGLNLSALAKEVLSEQGLVCDHVTQLVSTELIAWADLVLTMTLAHKLYLCQIYPEAQHKIYVLKEYVQLLATESLDILDPFGGDLPVYRDCASELLSLLKELLSMLQN
ncbi:MAG: hypothetical protein RLZ12_1028 [Bacillota bacterium]|jgi:protein-tyrosine phosphatase